MSSIGTLGLSPTSAPIPGNGHSSREAAVEFEALMVAHLLQAAREADQSADDAALTSMRELAEQELARSLAGQGAFGLAGLIQNNLVPKTQ